MRRRLILLLALVGTIATATTAGAAILNGGPPRADVDNWGQIIAPKGRLTELGYFVTGSALSPDGRFLWTVGAGRVANNVQIVRAADGKVVQTIDAPSQALSGGVAFTPDGRHAYVSDTHDGVAVRSYAIDTRTGRATAGPTIALPHPADSPVVEDFPPGTSKQSYATYSAVSPDGRTLVVSLNLADYAAVIDLATRHVEYVKLDPTETQGEYCMPQGVAIIKRTAYAACESNGTVVAFGLDTGKITTVTPQPAAADPVSIDATKTHPYQIIASPDGRALYVSETNADRVMVLDPSDLSAPAGVIYVRRSEGLGTAPTGLALSPDARTLFVADAMENAVRAVALAPMTLHRPGGRTESVGADATYAFIPAGIYPDRVDVDPRTGQLFIVSAQGVGPGPNKNSDTAAPGFGDPQQDSIRMLSTLQSFALPRADAEHEAANVAALGAGGADAAVPVGSNTPPPAGSPIVGPNGGPSTKIKYVFYVVAENKTYDSYFGDLSRSATDPTAPGDIPVGNGDPCLTLFGQTRILPRHWDGAPCPQSRFRSKAVVLRTPGMRTDGSPLTPNYHKLARSFVDLDNFYSDTTSSDDGHIFSASGYTDDYELRSTQANNGPSPRPFDIVYPQVAPPKGFLFDLMAENRVSFFNYGEAVSGTLIPDPGLDPSERAIRAQVLANSDFVNYPSSAAIDINPISAGVNVNVNNPASLAKVGAERVDDANEPDEATGAASTLPGGATAPTRQSRAQFFQQRLGAELATPGCLASPGDPAACSVPQFNYLVMPNNHTAGTNPGRRTPDALIRDNDLGVGQVIDTISHSAIWPYSAVFVIQDDPQDGADHVDAHRMVGLVASPYAKRTTVVSTHYDEAGVIHTIEDILGVRPDYFQDALAPPLFDAFTSTPDTTPYSAVPIAQSLLDEVNPPRGPMARISARQTWSADRVNPNLVNQILWAYRYGTARACPGGLGDDGNSPCRRTRGDG